MTWRSGNKPCEPLPSPLLSSYSPSPSPLSTGGRGGDGKEGAHLLLQSRAGGRALPAIGGGRQRSLMPAAAPAPTLRAGNAGVTPSGTRLARGGVTSRLGPPRPLRPSRPPRAPPLPRPHLQQLPPRRGLLRRPPAAARGIHGGPAAPGTRQPSLPPALLPSLPQGPPAARRPSPASHGARRRHSPAAAAPAPRPGPPARRRQRRHLRGERGEREGSGPGAAPGTAPQLRGTGKEADSPREGR